MPKLIDYPRTSYPGAWEVAEVVDDTGGKSALETCARKLNRKVSGSFKAIVGSAVKFGLLTSKREILTTTTLFRRIKHAYDKQEELLFHREAFLTPPLFMQLCRKFRSRELPVAMLDVLLIREFGVEEINAQGVAKAFTDGARMMGLLDEHNIMADVDHLAAQQPPQREIASPPPTTNNFRQAASNTGENDETGDNAADNSLLREETPAEVAKPRAVVQTTTAAATNAPLTRGNLPLPASRPAPVETTDAIAHLFGLGANTNHSPSSTAAANQTDLASATTSTSAVTQPSTPTDRAKPTTRPASNTEPMPLSSATESEKLLFRLQLTGPGLETTLEVSDADDLLLVRALLDKIERQLKRNQ